MQREIRKDLESKYLPIPHYELLRHLFTLI